MKAIVLRSYGSPDVLQYEDVEKPDAAADEVLVKVRAASVNPLDWRLVRGEPYVIRAATGWLKPKSERVGADLAGEVEAVGRNVKRFRPGDSVFGAIGASPGAFAEYVCAKEAALVLKPTNLSFEQAAAIPVAGLTALQGLRQGRLLAGQTVLINGAAGGVGTFSVQIAKSLGAHVTGVCSSRNVEMVRSIGADDVVDYTRDDFTTSAMRYDLVFDCIGNRSLSACRRVMRQKGTYVIVGGPGGRWLGPLGSLAKPLLLSPFVSQRMCTCMSQQSTADLLILKELVESNKVKPVIDRTYALSARAQALLYLEEGHARGKVVITVQRG